MTVICELAFVPCDPSAPGEQEFLRRLASVPELVSLDLYAPAAEETADPYAQDGPATAHLAMLAFASLDALERASRHESFAPALSRSAGRMLACTAMQRTDHPIAGADRAAALSAPFSYVVRYHRPAEDEALFVRHYIDNHPPLLARLPGIRNVMCYLPLAWRPHAGVEPADYMLGNEVVFDSIAAFNAAMVSPIRHELRAHFRQFPPFSGRNTHFAMQRRRLPIAAVAG